MSEDLDDIEREQIADFIKEGFTEGRVNHDSVKNVYWKLVVSVWRNDACVPKK